MSPSSTAPLALTKGSTTHNPPKGTCPGDGHCDGTGGNSSCSGCPAFNNRVAKVAEAAAVTAAIVATGGTDGLHHPEIAPKPHQSVHSTEMQCHNCGTTNTPLWRRDEDGKPICNACGRVFSCFLFLT